ncbi:MULTISPECIES: methionine ABC transporter substrate-binding lipoprotein MetQ [Candidatus Williamhamiltonella]|uniref:Lipoprotein n=1 Tax=Candidatus Williamhamiltonella defendens TaxID=138072 RepID=A0A2D3TBK3_9ENTR|nr:methionine ABC transporter substrate-binding lipoprotein MetQ [Candidatus Hamiltonella defensa]ATW33168.1 methionine ABC transporter substrate-binding protein MetQ [Candidatus Hamiltonella defensa]AYB49849.1 methionine ABC transporter substrate-binding protein MetQ [Candidatus Hamiltonella defensa]
MLLKLKSIKIAAILAVLASCFIVAGCDKKDEKDSNHIKVGVISGPEQTLAQVAQKVAKDQYGLDVELITFNDYVLPNEALNKGDIDVNVFQHQPYLDQQIQDRGYELVAIGNAFIYPMAGYSKEITSLNELTLGYQITMPNDPANLGRALLLLQKQGLIKLKPDVGLMPTVLDVIENPKDLTLVQLDAPQLPTSLDDKENVAIINTTYASQIGLSPTKDGLFVEDKSSPYVNLIVTRKDSKDDEKVKNFVKAYQSPLVEKEAEKIFQGGAVKGW